MLGNTHSVTHTHRLSAPPGRCDRWEGTPEAAADRSGFTNGIGGSAGGSDAISVTRSWCDVIGLCVC